jgi:hypothetical protein
MQNLNVLLKFPSTVVFCAYFTFMLLSEKCLAIFHNVGNTAFETLEPPDDSLLSEQSDGWVWLADL